MGFYFDEVDEAKPDRCWTKTIGHYRVGVTRAIVFGKPSAGFGMIIRQPRAKYLVAGLGILVSFTYMNPKSNFSGILRAEEKEMGQDSSLRTLRVLNGDETNHGTILILASQNPDVGIVPIPVFAPARTMIAECMPYSLEETM